MSKERNLGFRTTFTTREQSRWIQMEAIPSREYIVCDRPPWHVWACTDGFGRSSHCGRLKRSLKRCPEFQTFDRVTLTLVFKIYINIYYTVILLEYFKCVSDHREKSMVCTHAKFVLLRLLSFMIFPKPFHVTLGSSRANTGNRQSRSFFKEMSIFSCVEAFPGSRAFLENASNLWWSQRNHVFKCFCVFSCVQLGFRYLVMLWVYVVFVAFSWGETFLVAAAFLSVTSVRSTVFSNYC